MREHPDTIDIALDARSKGIVAIPVIEGTKTPAVKWKEWQTRMPTEELLRQWFRHRCHIAIVCSSMVLFDCDDPEKEDLVIGNCGDTPYRVRTPSGGCHLGYRRRGGVEIANQVDIKGMAIDIRTNGGIALIPTSRTEKGEYTWIGEGLRPVKDLPLARISWTRTRKKTRKPRPLDVELPESTSGIRNPEAYCLKIESIQGQNGSKGLVRVVCILRDAGRTAEQAFDFIMNHWNPVCARPKWSAKEVMHAINRHFG